MYFLFSEEFINGSVVNELIKPSRPHDNMGYQRRLCMIDLCYYTILGHENIQTASDLARLVNTTPRQAQIVWDILIKHGVLRKGPQGYSARAWMIERGILGDINKRRRQPEQQDQSQGQQPPGYHTDGNKTSW